MQEITQVLDRFAPPHLAESWDNVGLIVGDPNTEVKKVLCALDLNEGVVDEAIEWGAQCIVTHHPFLFKPIKQIHFNTPKGKIIKKLINHDLNVFCMHTNFDVTKGGINDWLGTQLELEAMCPLSPTYTPTYYKLVVYVPKTHVETVRNQIIAWNQTKIGDYTGCTFTQEGEGTFIPQEGSTPYRGTQDQLEKVTEVSISCIVKDQYKEKLIKKIKDVHPYEEVAYDLIPVEWVRDKEGLGRWGKCKPITLEALITKLKKQLGIQHVRVSGQVHHPITRIALCSGSGSSYIHAAAQKAEVYITGDMTFHDAQEAVALGLTVIDVGHYGSEVIGMPIIQDVLCTHFRGLEVKCSLVDGEMFKIY